MRTWFVASVAVSAHLATRHITHSPAVPAEGGSPVVVARDEVRIIECRAKPRNCELQYINVHRTGEVQEMPFENVTRVQARSKMPALHFREVVEEADLVDGQKDLDLLDAIKQRDDA